VGLKIQPGDEDDYYDEPLVPINSDEDDENATNSSDEM